MVVVPTCVCGDCKKCRHRESKRRWRHKNPDKVRAAVNGHRERNIEQERARDRERGKTKVRDPQKEWARNKARILVRKLGGRPPCEVCGATRAEAHHEDYDRPLDVRWLCHRHHMELHRRVSA